MRTSKKRLALWIVGGLVLFGLFLASRNVCLSAYFRYGVTVRECPEGTPRIGAALSANSLRRGSRGSVQVHAPVFYTTGPADEQQVAYGRRFSAELSLVVGDEVTKLEPFKGWEDQGTSRYGQFTLPGELPDGDHRLRVTLETPLGPAQHEIALPVYAPAKVHVITDRPLYEPGNLIQFRAVVLRARDLAPLDGRPGKFVVRDPSGQVVMEQRTPVGEFGIAQADFPLDGAAPVGAWQVAYETGQAKDATSVMVEPFTLPRFSVEAAPAQPFYGVGRQPVIEGTVRYSSGAPVAGARLDLAWSSSGAWPPPTSWMQGGLPKVTYTEDDGRFELRLPRVPGDLVGQARLAASITAVDPAGDRVGGSVQVLLSKDAISASAVTELEGGLVEGFNNRLYVRVTTPDGRPLRNTDLVVQRAWDDSDEGKPAKTDADGVAALQVDPGPAVNVLIPAPPVRPPPRPDPVVRVRARDHASSGSVGLADQVSLDAQEDRLEPCVRFAGGGQQVVQVGLRVAPSGRPEAVTHGDGPLAACVGAVAKGLSFRPGALRVLELGWRLTADLPTVGVQVSGTPVVPDAVRTALNIAALDARRCLPEDVPRTNVGAMLLWQAEPGKRTVALRFVPDSAGTRTRLSSGALRCVQSTFSAARLTDDYPKGADRAFGVARLSVSPGARYEASARQDTTQLGYELKITASVDDEELGHTKLFLPPGTVPPIRLRATPVLAAAGQTVQIAVLRGPAFQGELPEELYWRHDGRSDKMKLDPETKTAQFQIPNGASGWFEVQWGGGRALVFVRPLGELAVSVAPDRATYAPGDTARLAIKTAAGGKGAPAAVSLIGVDETLGQLAPLPGPDEMARLRAQPIMPAPAFGVLDAQALSLGRIQGANAAEATVARVAAIPSPAEIDRYVSAQGRTNFDPVEGLTDNFYRALGSLYERVRQWEAQAPKAELMRPAVMASLWQDALTNAAKAGEPVEDAYGRALSLSVLPDDLLALADPRVVVIDGTRLPEDVENWIAWVRKEQP